MSGIQGKTLGPNGWVPDPNAAIIEVAVTCTSPGMNLTFVAQADTSPLVNDEFDVRVTPRRSTGPRIGEGGVHPEGTVG